MNQTGTDLLPVGTDPAYQEGRQTVTDIDTDNDSENRAELQTHGTGHRLQDTDYR